MQMAKQWQSTLRESFRCIRGIIGVPSPDAKDRIIAFERSAAVIGCAFAFDR